ncbi:unnamed protein product [Pleuronectes platessa]|uniref:Uncharacterized protein n=1 Tax=Pleuronectes platessa TaxID=8262 RepID=A0A9N7UKH7_PLEPL|nr:unnamed protein product [Pleuronectes platessa]
MKSARSSTGAGAASSWSPVEPCVNLAPSAQNRLNVVEGREFWGLKPPGFCFDRSRWSGELWLPAGNQSLSRMKVAEHIEQNALAVALGFFYVSGRKSPETAAGGVMCQVAALRGPVACERTNSSLVTDALFCKSRLQ